MPAEVGYLALAHGWPIRTKSPDVNAEEMQQVRRAFSSIYRDAIVDLKESDMDEVDSAALARLVVADTDDADFLRSLRSALLEERPLRGRTSLVESTPKSGQLGGVVEVLEVAVGTGGAIGILAAAAVQWVRQQSSDIKLKIAIGGNTTEIHAKRVKALQPHELGDYIEAVTAAMNESIGSCADDRPNDAE